MAWTEITWSCGHTGKKQLYGKTTKRDAQVAWEAGRRCMACWLLDQWKKNDDPRNQREDKIDLAIAIARGKDVKIEMEEP